MKLKLTGKFLLAILFAVFISLYIYMGINLIMRHIAPKVLDESNDLIFIAGRFSSEFADAIEYENDEITIKENDLESLKEKKAWIQVIDETGEEIYSRFKTEGAKDHYTVGELTYYSEKSGTLDGYTLYIKPLEAGNRRLSYVIGFPVKLVTKYIFNYSPKTFFRNDLLFGSVLYVLIAVLVGYFFSRYLTRPIRSMGDLIKDLAEDKYVEKVQNVGIYGEVYDNVKVLSERLRSSEIERNKTEKTREEWISNITHDLKTPLASIKGYSELLLDSTYDLETHENEKFAKVILEKSDYMESLIEDLKLTYQLENEIFKLNKRDENIVSLLRETVIDVLNHPSYENRHIEFETELDTINFSCDGKLMQRAFSNIIYNAIVHNHQDCNIDISVKSEKGIEITIKDDGSGISKEDLEKLFQRYYRGTNTGAEHKGSGLGMAISRQIVEAHGGKIEVESTVGVGTIIHLNLGDIHSL